MSVVETFVPVVIPPSLPAQLHGITKGTTVPRTGTEAITRGRDGEFARFINIAIGSAAEADSLLLHAGKVGAASATVCSEMLAELTVVRKMLFKLRRAIAPKQPVSVVSDRTKD